LLNKLKSLPSYYLTQFQYNNDIGKSSSYMTIGNFVKSLNNLVKLYNYYSSDLESLKYVLISFHKLLCNTFITTPKHDLDIKDFKVQNRKIILGIWVENNYNHTQLTHIKEKNILMQTKTKEEREFFFVKSQ